MLLKEDGHLDIERVNQLNEAELDEEMDSWTEDQLYDWVTRNGVMSHEEVFGYLRQKINEYYAQQDDSRLQPDKG